MAYLEFKHNPDHNLRHTPNKLDDMSGSLHVSLTRRAEGSAPRRCRPGRRSKMPKSHYLDPTQTVKQGATIADASQALSGKTVLDVLKMIHLAHH